MSSKGISVSQVVSGAGGAGEAADSSIDSPIDPFIDPREFRTSVGAFATGIAIVACRDPANPAQLIGVTVNSFTSVSLTPPLISFCLDRKAFSFKAFAAAPPFSVNILAADQKALSETFARPSREDRFAGLAVSFGRDGQPLLPDCLAQIECLTEAIHDAGDHILILGRVTGLHRPRPESAPLLYFRGRYALVAPDQPAD